MEMYMDMEMYIGMEMLSAIKMYIRKKNKLTHNVDKGSSVTMQKMRARAQTHTHTHARARARTHARCTKCHPNQYESIQLNTRYDYAKSDRYH